ncbi:oligosaccharide flippase family protein [Mycobacterium sp. 4D054]|uniref:oligosaccharide flippase family protein n=1 Tax=Mycobacterium sp. 4D054 TaxID=3457440 RepID=UPI003FCFAA10
MIKHLGGMGFARGLHALAQAVLFILLARDIGPQGFGVIAAFLVVHTSVFWFVGMDTPTYVARKMALGEIGNAVVSVRVNAALMALAMVPVMASCALLASQTLLMFAVIGNAVAVWNERVTENRLALAYGEKRIKPAVITLVVRSMVPLALYLGLTATAIGVEALIAFAIARVLAGVASQSLGVLLIRLPAASELPRATTVLREQAPLAANSAMSGIRTLDSVIVIAISGSVAAGVYSAVSRVVSPFNTLVLSIAPVLVPRAAVASSARVRRAMDGLLGVGLVLSAATLLLIPFTEFVVVFVFGPKFAGGGAVLFWMLLRAGPMLATPLMGATLLAKGRDKLVAINSFATTLLLLAAVAAGALADGATGAAAGFALVSLVRMVVLWTIGRRALADMRSA